MVTHLLTQLSFASIVKGLMWGRAVNDSVKKFLQVSLLPYIDRAAIDLMTCSSN